MAAEEGYRLLRAQGPTGEQEHHPEGDLRQDQGPGDCEAEEVISLLDTGSPGARQESIEHEGTRVPSVSSSIPALARIDTVTPAMEAGLSDLVWSVEEL